MTPGDSEFLQRLRATFRIEADEHLQAMSSLLLELERPAAGAQQAPLVESLFRETHSLKGAARAVNATELEQVCQAMERVLASLKRQDSALSPAVFDTLHASLNGLARLLSDEAADPEAAGALIGALETLPREPIDAAPAVGVEGPMPAMPSVSPAGETVRVAVSRLESLLIQAEELLTLKFGAQQLAEELGELCGTLAQSRRDADKRARQVRAMRRAPATLPPTAHDSLALGRQRRLLAQLLDAVERDELEVKSLGERAARLERLATQERRALAGMVDNLIGDMKQALMLPFASLLEGVPKLVRDLAHDSGKQLELEMHGATLEIDRRILEQMKTPLIHLVRNAVDHGIEMPEQRRRSGKPAVGHITIEVVPREGNRAELVVADDGGGIGLAGVRSRAQQMGLRSASELAALNERDTLALVFESGLSTSPILTDLSGHGLGLAIVREKVEKLGGSITVDARDGQGTRFSIVLPATLATFRGLLVAVGDRQFVLPSRHVERVARIEATAVKTVEGRETIELERQVLSWVHLGDVLQLRAGAPGDKAQFQLVVLAIGGKRMAFAVDEVLGDQEVLVKPLGAPLKRVQNVAAATVLGAGHVVPLLDVGDLMKSALRPRAPRGPVAATPAPRRSLLVVEDSITSRALLKGILESAGYDVQTAVDGMDALTQLGNAHFDLVVSDVEMPRLDGFGLTARLRADKQWARLPVVLVTALGTREDKERGIDAGANAYIVKGSFDQGKLLEVIRRLV